MNKRQQETIQSMIIAFLVANLGSITLYSIANRGWLGEWGKHRARYTDRKLFIIGPVFLALSMLGLGIKGQNLPNAQNPNKEFLYHTFPASNGHRHAVLYDPYP